MLYSELICEALEYAIENIKKKYNSDWLITVAEWDSRESIPLEKFSKVCKYFSHVDFHVHAYFEICILIEGKSAIRIRDIVKELGVGDVLLLSPNYMHQELPYKNKKCMTLWLAFEPGETRVHLAGHNEKEDFFIREFHILDIDYIVYDGLFYDIQKGLHSNTRWSLDKIKVCVMNLLLIVSENLEQKKHSSDKNDWKHSIVKSVVRYIENNYQNNQTLSGISQHFGISMSYLNSIFKSITGKTVVHFMNDYKIAKGKELLRTTNLRIKDIAIMLDYYDQYHFSKAFKKSVGISPTQFRKLNMDLGKG